MRTLAVTGLFLIVSAACSSPGLEVGHDLNALTEAGLGGDATHACQAAGGMCVLGNVSCADQAPASAQDCNPDRNPGGAFCCLSRGATDAGGQDARGSEGGGGGGDAGGGGGGSCQSAGGKCVLGNVSCAKEAPASDQDCNPDHNPGGSFCCLARETACEAAGGTCVLGSVSCADKAPASDQDCNPDHNPGGAFCCLAHACEAAGGMCVLGNVHCTKKAPSKDQDCNPDRNPGGSFCCLEE